MAGLQQLEHFIEQPALRHIGQQLGGGDQRRLGLGLDREAECSQLGRETDGANDPHRVFAVARGRVADHAEREFLRVLDAVVIVDHQLAGRVVIHRIDGEVAARRVFVLRAPDVVAQHAAAGIDGVRHTGEFALASAFVALDLLRRRVVHVGAKGRYLDHFMLAATPIHHVHDAKPPPDDEGPAEQALDLLGRGIGGHVEILGPQAQQQIAHRAAHHIGFVARPLQGGDDVEGALVDQRRIDAVDRGRYFLALAEARLASGSRIGFSEQFVDEILDHWFLWRPAKSMRALRYFRASTGSMEW